MFVLLIFLLKFKASHLEGVDVDGDDVQQQLNAECPSSSGTSACPCYKFDHGKITLSPFLGVHVIGAWQFGNENLF
jgi:hypothetical protein